MAGELRVLLGRIHELADQPLATRQTDAELVSAFGQHGDVSCFERLLARHGQMVWRVRRRLARREQDAEDAFQATFLSLATKVRSIRTPEAVGGWLYRVAYRTSWRIRDATPDSIIFLREPQTTHSNTSPFPKPKASWKTNYVTSQSDSGCHWRCATWKKCLGTRRPRVSAGLSPLSSVGCKREKHCYGRSYRNEGSRLLECWRVAWFPRAVRRLRLFCQRQS